VQSRQIIDRLLAAEQAATGIPVRQIA